MDSGILGWFEDESRVPKFGESPSDGVGDTQMLRWV
jgi:hypothetical protein